MLLHLALYRVSLDKLHGTLLSLVLGYVLLVVIAWLWCIDPIDAHMINQTHSGQSLYYDRLFLFALILLNLQYVCIMYPCVRDAPAKPQR